MKHLLGYTLDQLGEAVSGVIVDEAGFIKKGAPSVGCSAVFLTNSPQWRGVTR